MLACGRESGVGSAYAQLAALKLSRFSSEIDRICPRACNIAAKWGKIYYNIR